MVVALLGVLLINVPILIFPVCEVGQSPLLGGPIDSRHGCHGTLHAEVVLGAITVATGFLLLISSTFRLRLAAYVVVLTVAVLAVLFPVTITGVCKMPTMPCRLGTVPALVTVGVFLGIVGLWGMISFLGNERK